MSFFSMMIMKTRSVCWGKVQFRFFIAAYYSYYILNKGKCHNDKFVKEYKYYIICAMRAYICGKEIFAGNKKQQKKQYKALYQVIEDKSIERIFKIARSCLEELVNNLDSKVANNRGKELTQKMLSKILELKKEIDNPTCLEKSSEVHCIVVSKDKYKIEFDIKTSDKKIKGMLLVVLSVNRKYSKENASKQK